MPVDPGNLICLGRISERPALVLPGCARSPKLNGIDFVLRRLFAGLKVTPADVMRMGPGGLLKEIDVRPMPREEGVGGASARPRAAQRTGDRGRGAGGGAVAADGAAQQVAGRRQGRQADGRAGGGQRAVVQCSSGAGGARPPGGAGGAGAGRETVRYVQAPDYAEGLSASLKAGIAAVPPDCAAALVCLGDMPLVTGRMIDRLLAAYDPDEGRLIVLPVFHGKQGNPMLWDRRFFRNPADHRQFRRSLPVEPAHGSGGGGGSGGRRGVARFRHGEVAGDTAAAAAAGGGGVRRTGPGGGCNHSDGSGG